MSALSVLLVALAAPAAPPSGPKLSLEQLLAFARDNPAVEAAAHALAGFESRLSEAHRAWWPQGTVSALAAPAPEVRCLDADGVRSSTACVQTDAVDAEAVVPAGVFTRVELKLGMPLYTFGKLSAARSAARSGVAAGHAQVEMARQQISYEVHRAFWGSKLARELLFLIDEGREYIVKAKAKIEADLDEGRGEATETDRLRLNVLLAEVDARALEAQRLREMARAGLAVLATAAPKDFEIDDAPFAPLDREIKPLAHYLEVARLHRPEVRALDAGLAARRAAQDVEVARLYPDLLLVGTLSWARAPTVDDPENFFYSDPFNGLSAGVAATLTTSLDYGLKLARLRRAQAEEREMEARRRQALGGIGFEIEKTYAELVEARARLETLRRGEKAAKSWLTATYQNMMAGLAEAKDLTDALLAFFTLRLRYFQAIYDVNTGWAALERSVGTARL